jgi:hypothetical protein
VTAAVDHLQSGEYPTVRDLVTGWLDEVISP